MKIILLIIILSIPCISRSQDVLDEIKISIDSSISPSFFYEGQEIIFTYIIENLSENIKNYEKNSFVYIEKIQSSDGGVVHKKRKKIMLDYEKNSIAPTLHASMPGKFKRTESLYAGFDSFGNTDLKQLLGLSDSIYKRNYPSKPSFLAPGKYELILVFPLIPTQNIIRTSYHFEVISPNGVQSNQFKGYLNALNYSILNYYSPNIDMLTGPNSLWEELKNNIDSPYSQDIFNLLSGELSFRPVAMKKFRSDPAWMYKLFEKLPELSKFEATYFGVWFMRFHGHKFSEFAKYSNSPLPEYLNSYLKKIAHLNPAISKELITQAVKYFNINNLHNYAEDKKNSK